MADSTAFPPELKKLVQDLLEPLSEIRVHCDRFLQTWRYDGNVVLMVVDAGFTSIGLNYFRSVVSKILEFRRRFGMKSLKELVNAKIEDLTAIWRNRRSWNVVIEAANVLTRFSDNDREALGIWARNSQLENREEDSIGKIRGMGLITYQYLRMMGGRDTVMPGRIVKRVLSKLLGEAGIKVPKAERVADHCNCRAIELCWAPWLLQYDEGERKRYLQLLNEL